MFLTAFTIRAVVELL